MMAEVAPLREAPVPRWVPALLAFVAGFVDVYTFLALFGLFVAQVTGSFVIGAAQLVSHDVGITGKMLAIVAFIVAAGLTAGLIDFLRDRRRAPLPWTLGVEAALLAVFTLLIEFGPVPANAVGWQTILAGVFGAMAMGTQSVIVRLLMRGIPQTNVMTGNMTRLGVETTELIIAWRRYARNRANPALGRELAAAWSELAMVLAIASGFLLGAAAGAAAYGTTGLAGAPFAVALVAALTLWAIVRRRPRRH